jgi:hypothetical protein
MLLINSTTAGTVVLLINSSTGDTRGVYQYNDGCHQWRRLSVAPRVPLVEEFISNTTVPLVEEFISSTMVPLLEEFISNTTGVTSGGSSTSGTRAATDNLLHWWHPSLY